jgi:hypothetical protein
LRRTLLNTHDHLVAWSEGTVRPHCLVLKCTTEYRGYSYRDAGSVLGARHREHGRMHRQMIGYATLGCPMCAVRATSMMCAACLAAASASSPVRHRAAVRVSQIGCGLLAAASSCATRAYGEYRCVEYGTLDARSNLTYGLLTTGTCSCHCYFVLFMEI